MAIGWQAVGCIAIAWRAAAGKPATDTPALVKFAVTDPNLGEYLLGAVDGVDGAWEKLARSAMKYGVMPAR